MRRVATSISEMANAVRELALLEQKRLIELDELTAREGYSFAEGLAGLRIMVARVSAAQLFLRELAPYETALRIWLDGQRIGDKRVETTPPTP
jgi:hypothetical protein